MRDRNEFAVARNSKRATVLGNRLVQFPEGVQRPSVHVDGEQLAITPKRHHALGIRRQILQSFPSRAWRRGNGKCTGVDPALKIIPVLGSQISRNLRKHLP